MPPYTAAYLYIFFFSFKIKELGVPRKHEAIGAKYAHRLVAVNELLVPSCYLVDHHALMYREKWEVSNKTRILVKQTVRLSSGHLTVLSLRD